MKWWMWVLLWLAAVIFMVRWIYIATGPKSPEEQAAEDEEQMRYLRGESPTLEQENLPEPDDTTEIVDGAIDDCYGEDVRRVGLDGDRPAAANPRSLPRDWRRRE